MVKYRRYRTDTNYVVSGRNLEMAPVTGTLLGNGITSSQIGPTFNWYGSRISNKKGEQIAKLQDTDIGT
jgi:hypothetical protein